MATNRNPLLLLLLLTFLFLQSSHVVRFAGAGQRRVHITDDLDDVVDSEEDEAWKEWGKKPGPTLPDYDPAELDRMDEIQLREVMMKSHAGLTVGFVKLRFGVKRTMDAVTDIAKRWSKIMKSGAIEVTFMGIDLSTLMFNLPRGQDWEEVKDFILNQPEAYEVKIGKQDFRRPGDPPLDDVLEKLREEREKGDSKPPGDNAHQKEEL